MAYTNSTSDIPVGDIIDTGHIAITYSLNSNNLKPITSLAILDGPSAISRSTPIRFDNLDSLYLSPRIKNLKNAFGGNICRVWFDGPLDSYDSGFNQESNKKISYLEGVNTVDNMFLIVGDALVCSAAIQLQPDDTNDKYINLPNVKTLKKNSLSYADYISEGEYGDDDYLESGVIFNIPDSVVNIERDAFVHSSRGTAGIIRGGKNLTMLIVNNELLLYCGLLPDKHVEIPNGVTYLDTSLFNNTRYIEKITVPSSVVEIGRYAFYAPNLTECYMASPEPPAVNKGSQLFGDAIQKIYVPIDAVNKYKTATNWTVWADKIEGYEFN